MLIYELIYDVNDYQRNNKLVIGVYLGTGMGFSIWNQEAIYWRAWCSG